MLRTRLAALLLLAVLASLSNPASAAGPAYDPGVAKNLVALSYAAACHEKDILSFTCPWCAKTAGDYAGFKTDAYVAHAPTQGAAFTGYNARTNQIVVVYRSTVLTKWESIMVDFTFAKVDYKGRDGQVHGQVHKGFSEAYRALDQAGVGASIDKLIKEHPTASLACVGHSLGGALATHAAADLAPRFANKLILVYSFGSPRVGDKDFAAWFATLPVTYYRSTTADDPVPHTPKLAQGFLHVGSGQEEWFRNIGDVTPQACPMGENGACANTVKFPVNFALAHATYLGHKFDQCGIGPLADVPAWFKNAAEAAGDVFEEAKHGLAKAGGSAASTTQKTEDAAKDAGKKTEDAAKDAGKKTEDAAKDAGKKTEDAAKDAGKVLKKVPKVPKIPKPKWP